MILQLAQISFELITKVSCEEISFKLVFPSCVLALALASPVHDQTITIFTTKLTVKN